MSLGFAARQALTLARVAADHLSADPVFFAMQVSRRLPNRVSQTIGRALRIVPSPACAVAARWLQGDHPGAEAVLASQRSATGLRAQVLGELALNLGMQDAARELAGRAGPSRSRGLRSRIAWQTGDLSGAVHAAGTTRQAERLRSELTVWQTGWAPTLPAQLPRVRSERADIVHLLTNSLPHTQSGYALRSHALLRAVSAAGTSVVAATRPGYPVSVGRFSADDRSTIDGITYLRDVPWRLGRTLEDRLSQQAAYTAAVAAAADAAVIHTTTHFVNGIAAQAAAQRLGIPWIYEVRGVLEETWAASAANAAGRDAARASERYRLFRARETEIACAADRVVTLGRTMAAELVARGVDAGRILIAANGVSEAVLARDVDRPTAEVRQAAGLSRTGAWVGTAASIVAYEGLDVLVDAVAQARACGTDVRLLIIGDGTALPGLRHRAAEHGLGDAAVFTGRLPQAQAQELICGLDIFAVPRRDDPVCALVTPVKPVEAAGLGRPVLLSDLPALTEALPQSAATAVPAGDVRAWAEALTRLAENPEIRAQMGAAGRRYAAEHRTWDAVGRAYHQMYAELRAGRLSDREQEVTHERIDH